MKINFNSELQRAKSLSVAMRAKLAQGYVIGVARLGYMPSHTHASFGTDALPDPAVEPHLREAFLLAAL